MKSRTLRFVLQIFRVSQCCPPFAETTEKHLACQLKARLSNDLKVGRTLAIPHSRLADALHEVAKSLRLPLLKNYIKSFKILQSSFDINTLDSIALSCLHERYRWFAERYWQPGNLNDAIRVLQLNEPLAFRYSVVYQNVQSSTGSTVIAL